MPKASRDKGNHREEETYVDYPINHVSLCAGYGGIDLGLERVLPACRTVAYVEIEAFACANLVSKMEAGELASAPIWTDLHTFPFDQFDGVVDIITAGFPCQPFSQAGARRGVEDKRHLWPQIAEGIRRSRPALVFMENVDGIVTAKSPGHHSVLQHVLGDLEGMGYRATAGLYTAQEVGSPHGRKRWFILGMADTDRSPCQGRGVSSGVHSEHDHAHREGATAGELADTNNSRGWEDQQPSEQGSDWTQQPPNDTGHLRTRAPEQVTRWPAGPGQEQHPWEEPRTTQPGVGGAPDGSASGADPALHRVDRLRLLGNGVVPDQAARAFHDLLTELTSTNH